MNLRQLPTKCPPKRPDDHADASSGCASPVASSSAVLPCQRPKAKGVTPTPRDAWIYSKWRGNLDQPAGTALKTWFDGGGARTVHIHTSGHAPVKDLKAFAAAMKPKKLVPIHGAAWGRDGEGFSNIVRLRDGEPLMI